MQEAHRESDADIMTGNGPGPDGKTVRIAVVSIGDELLNGHTLNSNLLFIGAELDKGGFSITAEQCVPDDDERIAGAVTEALHDNDAVITIGGLGPTSDDRTREAVTRVLGVQLRPDPAVQKAISEYLAKRGITAVNVSRGKQALVPDNADVIENGNGTAPGLWCTCTDGKVVIMLPGPPRELKPMFTDRILPRLQRLGSPDHASREMHVCGLPESLVADRVEKILDRFANVAPAYCTRPDRLRLRLTARPECMAELREAAVPIRAALGSALLPPGCDSLAATVGDLLCVRSWHLATAESCTGGGIGEALTDIPGASDWFAGGIIAYSNHLKEQLLGVHRTTLETHGAVSREVAEEMVHGVTERCATEAGISVTGIAGPSGGTAEKPVGLVFIGTVVGNSSKVERFVFPGSRDTVRKRTVATALNQLRLQITDLDSSERTNR